MIRCTVAGVTFELETVAEAAELVGLLSSPTHPPARPVTPRSVKEKLAHRPTQPAPRREPATGGRPTAVTQLTSTVAGLLRKAGKDGLRLSEVAWQSKHTTDQCRRVLVKMQKAGRARSTGRAQAARWHAAKADVDDPEPARSATGAPDPQFERVWDGSMRDVSLVGDGYRGSSLSAAQSQ